MATILVGLVQLNAVPAAQAEPILVGYRDYTFPSGVAGNEEVTSEKPESKLWWNDGYWWASMWSNDGDAYHIFRLDESTQTWIDTEVALDDRMGSRADALWDGNKLYVVSHLWEQGGSSAPSGSRGELFRYSYSGGTYTLDANFPVEVNGGRSETLVIDKDANGKLWVTYVQDDQVMVNRTVGQDWEWGTPFVLPVPEAQVTNDDVSSVITYNQYVGIMWSSQTSGNTMYFAWHDSNSANDMNWSSLPAFSDDGDDHLNLKSMQADNAGNIFAVVKGGHQADLITVLVCAANNNYCKSENDWTSYNVYNSNQHNPTRPILLIDTSNRDLYVFTRNDDGDGDAIYYKVTSLDNIQFDSADIGTPFIKSEDHTGINDPTSTKQNLSSNMGLVVMASDQGARTYFHNMLELSGNPQHTLTVNVVGNGSVDQDPPGIVYNDGEVVTLTAIPADGWQFSGWSGDLTGSTTPVQVTMDGDKTITALFTELPSNQRTLTVSVSPGGSGSVTLNPPGGVYNVGQTVQLTANPSAGYSFSHWSGDLTGSMNPTTITMDVNKTVTANFSEIPPTPYTLTMNVVGSGTVTPTEGQHVYNEGTVVPLQAEPDSGWVFAGWSGDLTSTEPSTTITMDGHKTVTATFLPQYTLDVNIVGMGEVTLSPAGGTYVEGTEVTLTASPDPSWLFRGWSGDVTSTETQVTVVMDGNKSVTATFALPEHTLTVNIEGQGSVALNPPGGEYAEGELVELTVTPDPGWMFFGWSGDLTGMNNPASILMNGDKTVTATFVPLQYDLNVTTLGEGNVTLDPPGGTYGEGVEVELTATPASGWSFSAWSGDLAGNANPATVIMDGSKTIEATFVQQETGIQVQISANPMTATVGHEVVYSYVVANIGQATLHDVAVQDDRLGAVTLDKTTLASGETAVGQLSDVVSMTDLPGPLQNTATATATSALAEEVSDEATVSVTLEPLPLVYYFPIGIGSASSLVQGHDLTGDTAQAARERPNLVSANFMFNRRLAGPR